MRTFLMLGLALPVFAQAQTADILCRGESIVQVFHIDYGKHLVNGAEANFSQDEIHWTSAQVDRGRVWYTDHTLNRVAGTYKHWTRDAVYAAPPPLLTCEKAPQPKF